jgi:parvulin-like peptidyl-prolyl isomerase
MDLVENTTSPTSIEVWKLGCAVSQHEAADAARPEQNDVPHAPAPPTPPLSCITEQTRRLGYPLYFQEPSTLAETASGSVNFATSAHTADLQHQVTLKSLALQTLQSEYASLLQKLQRERVKTQTIERKTNVADQEVNGLAGRNEELSERVQELELRLERLEAERTEFADEKEQWLRMLGICHRLQANYAEERQVLVEERDALQVRTAAYDVSRGLDASVVKTGGQVREEWEVASMPSLPLAHHSSGELWSTTSFTQESHFDDYWRKLLDPSTPGPEQRQDNPRGSVRVGGETQRFQGDRSSSTSENEVEPRIVTTQPGSDFGIDLGPEVHPSMDMEDKGDISGFRSSISDGEESEDPGDHIINPSSRIDSLGISQLSTPSPLQPASGNRVGFGPIGTAEDSEHAAFICPNCWSNRTLLPSYRRPASRHAIGDLPDAVERCRTSSRGRNNHTGCPKRSSQNAHSSRRTHSEPPVQDSVNMAREHRMSYTGGTVGSSGAPNRAD